MRFALALTLAFFAPLYVVSAGTPEMDLQNSYVAEKDALSELEGTAKAAAYEKLARHGHCTRAGNEWVGAWCMQNAAYAYWTSEKLDDAERCAKAVLESKSVKECEAMALGIMGAVAGKRGDWKAALDHYEASLKLDPNYETAKAGAKDCRTALARKG